MVFITLMRYGDAKKRAILRSQAGGPEGQQRYSCDFFRSAMVPLQPGMYDDFDRQAELLRVQKPVVKVHDVADRLGFKDRGAGNCWSCSRGMNHGYYPR